MIIGTMNHPGRDVLDEIEWMADMGLEFIDLTLEPPGVGSWMADAPAIAAALERRNLRAVGHTPWYIPIASSLEELRYGALAELRRCIDVFARIGVNWMNVHPDRSTPWHDRSFNIEQNLLSLRELLSYGRSQGVGVMIENLPGDFNSVSQLGALLDPLPELGLHLDIGHANLEVPYNQTGEILTAYGDRLRHVHLHDNKGGDGDVHLPLGAGTLDVAGSIRILRSTGYDDTITLEVFTPDKHYLQYSVEVLRRLWKEAGER